MNITYNEKLEFLEMYCYNYECTIARVDIANNKAVVEDIHSGTPTAISFYEDEDGGYWV